MDVPYSKILCYLFLPGSGVDSLMAVHGPHPRPPLPAGAGEFGGQGSDMAAKMPYHSPEPSSESGEGKGEAGRPIIKVLTKGGR